MDELLRDFLTETNESIDVVDVELVRFEQDPNNAKILNNIFRLVHTIKGTCGFLNLPRLEALTHAAEALMGKFRDGARVTGEAVTLILATIDRVKNLLEQLEQNQTEPAGNDRDLIAELERVAAATTPTQAAPQPNENVIDELERAFRETPGPRYQSGAVAPPAQDAQAGAADTGHVASRDEEHSDSKIANQSIRVHVDTLEHLMTMVSELVLTRNQLLDIGRRHEESEFKAPLQRLSNVTAELQEGVMKTRMQRSATRGRSCRGSCAICPPSLASRSNSRCRAPKPSSIARCSTSSRIR
jgi:two-component system chemotaxis sensor kinase CheA